MTRHGVHYIKDSWILGEGFPLASHNPANGEIVWQGHAATGDEVNAAVIAARSALDGWSLLTLEERVPYLEKFRTILSTSINSLAEAISKETGKPLWESKGEVQGMMNKVTISIEAYAQRCPKTVREHPAGLSVTRHKPHGVVAVLGPFNFPGHLPSGHIIPALLAGNTVVFKPSEHTPLVGEIMMQCWEQCELPTGTINMVQGGRETGGFLIGHPNINGLFFTGSWETGLIFSEQFAKHPDKILALEMGGNNPLVVSNVSSITAAAFTTVQSAFLTSGQRCSCARRLIVLKNEQGNAFVKELIRLIKNIKVGPYTDVPEPYMGPVISESSARYLLTVQETLKNKGGIPLCEMHLLKLDTALVSPALIDVTGIKNRLDEEIFGPLLQLIWVNNLHEAIAEANNTSYGLTAGLLSSSEEEYRIFYNQVRAGVINWNSALTGASSEAPFGGIGHSGNHRPSAFYAADYCAYPVASLENPEIKLPVNMPNGITI